MNCTASYVISQADLDAGFVTNVASATNGQVTSPTDTETVNAQRNPAISITKTPDPTTVTAAGHKVTYTFVVDNTGNVVLTNVIVTDPLPGLSVISCEDGNGTDNVIQRLTPTDAPVICTATYTVTQADMRAGEIINTVNATGKDPTGASISDDASARVLAKSRPVIPRPPEYIPAVPALGLVIQLLLLMGAPLYLWRRHR
jgi:uncharacterized repeat protein (TIGR01451 family)